MLPTDTCVELQEASTELLIHRAEGLLAQLVMQATGIELSLPLSRMTIDQAISRYGSYSPDLRFDLEIVQSNSAVNQTAFRVFAEAIEACGYVRGLKVVGGVEVVSRKRIDEWTAFVIRETASRGLAWFRVQPDGSLWSTFSKHVEREVLEGIKRAFQAQTGDMLLLLAGSWETTNRGLSLLRSRLANELNLYDASQIHLSWVVQGPPTSADPVRAEASPPIGSEEQITLVANGQIMGQSKILKHSSHDQRQLISTSRDSGLNVTFTLELDRIRSLLNSSQRRNDPSDLPPTQLAKDLTHYLPTWRST